MYINIYLKESFMKKSILFVLFTFISLMAFAKELEGKDLEAINKVKNATLYAEDFDDINDQLAYYG